MDRFLAGNHRAKVGNHFVEQGGLGAEFLGGAGTFLGGCGVALRDGIELVNGVVDEAHSLALLL